MTSNDILRSDIVYLICIRSRYIKIMNNVYKLKHKDSIKGLIAIICPVFVSPTCTYTHEKNQGKAYFFLSPIGFCTDFYFLVYIYIYVYNANFLITRKILFIYLFGSGEPFSSPQVHENNNKNGEGGEYEVMQLYRQAQCKKK